MLPKVLRITLSLTPWAAVLFLHYWLEHGDVWDVSMPYRALISVVLLAMGMALSFVLYNRLSKA